MAKQTSPGWQQGARRALLASTVLAGALASGAVLAAPSDAARLETLEKALAAQARQIDEQRSLIQQQQNQILDLKRGASAATSEAKRVQDDSPKLSFSGARPTFTSADGNFSLALRAIVQYDRANYFQKSPNGPADFRRAATGSDTAEAARARDLSTGGNFRRVRFGAEGTVARDWNYGLIFEYGGSGQEDGGRITDAWVGYTGLKPFRFQIGALAPATGFEDATSSTEGLFLERATAAELTRSLAGGDGRYSAGVKAAGETYTAAAFVTGGVISTPRDGGLAFPSSNTDEQVGLVSRVTYLPYKSKDALVHVGASLNWVINPPQVGDPSAAATGSRAPLRLRDRPELRVDGTRLIDTGNINADGARVYGAELGAQWKNFYGQGEYFHYEIDRKIFSGPALSDPKFNAWYLQGSWVITGEQRTYNSQNGAFGAPKPARNFNPASGNWGAWEVAARFTRTDLNWRPGSALVAERVRGGNQKIWTVGLNWYPNSNVRFALNYLIVDVDRLNPGGYTGALALPAADTEIGQNFQAVALRAQLAF